MGPQIQGKTVSECGMLSKSFPQSEPHLSQKQFVSGFGRNLRILETGVETPRARVRLHSQHGRVAHTSRTRPQTPKSRLTSVSDTCVEGTNRHPQNLRDSLLRFNPNLKTSSLTERQNLPQSASRGFTHSFPHFPGIGETQE